MTVYQGLAYLTKSSSVRLNERKVRASENMKRMAYLIDLKTICVGMYSAMYKYVKTCSINAYSKLIRWIPCVISVCYQIYNLLLLLTCRSQSKIRLCSQLT